MTLVHVDVANLGIEVEAPPALLARFGPGRTDGPVDLRYLLTEVGTDSVDLERDGGGLRRGVPSGVALTALTDDLVRVVVARRPGAVAVRGSTVTVAGRAVLVLGADTARRDLVTGLEGAGAVASGDDIVLLDQQGWVHPVGGPGGPVPLVLVVRPDGGPEVEEAVGARAVLGLLAELVVPAATSAAARAVSRRLAGHLVEVRGAVDQLDPALVVQRARALEVPAPVTGDRFGPEPEASTPVRPPVLVFDDILDPAEHQALLDLALGHTSAFRASGVHTGDGTGDSGDLHPDVRRSRSIYDLGDAWEPLRSRFVALLPHARRELGIPWFPLGDIEHHLTVHGDGDHFTRHVDNATPDTADRQVSAVYYFNRSPRCFTGGRLRLFDTVDRGGAIEPNDTYTDIEPADNRLVVFGSDAHHEVRPVHVEGDDPGDQRFTVVLWARRVPLVQSVFGGDLETNAARQHTLIPSLTEDSFRVVDTPPTVQEQLRRLLDEAGPLATPEAPDPTVLPTGVPRMVPVGALGDEVLAALQGLHEDWCGRRLVPSAAYGIRVYGEGQTLRSHCDRVETHVISSIVHVAADVDEPWPLTVLDAAGQVHEVVLAPGQLLLYESAKLPHGRPTPLRGRSYASLFCHYRPVGWEHVLAEVCRQASGPLAVDPQ